MDIKHEIIGFKVRGDKNYVDENVSEHGTVLTKTNVSPSKRIFNRYSSRGIPSKNSVVKCNYNVDID